MSEGINSLRFVHSTLSPPFFSLSVYYSPGSWLCCLFDFYSRQAGLSALMKCSPLVCCSASVFTRLSYCALLGKRERQEGARDKSLSRGQDISISPGFLSTEKWMTHQAQVCGCENPESNVVGIQNMTRHQSEVLRTLGSCNYPRIVFWIYLFKLLGSCWGVVRWWASGLSDWLELQFYEGMQNQGYEGMQNQHI